MYDSQGYLYRTVKYIFTLLVAIYTCISVDGFSWIRDLLYPYNS